MTMSDLQRMTALAEKRQDEITKLNEMLGDYERLAAAAKAENAKLRAQVLTNCVENLPDDSTLVKTDHWEAMKLQIDELQKELAFSKEVEITGDRLLADANRLYRELVDTVKPYHLWPTGARISDHQGSDDCPVCAILERTEKPNYESAAISAAKDILGLDVGFYGKFPGDICANYRDANGAIRSQYCSAFEANSQMHSPTCQFAEKRNDEIPHQPNCWCPKCRPSLQP
jgi:hypothetical protein